MIRSNLLARRVAAIAAAPAKQHHARAASTVAVDALLVARHPRGTATSTVSPAIVFPGSTSTSATITAARSFSADAATELGSILQREIEEEEEAAAEYGGKLPPDLAELDAEIRIKWTVLEGISGIGGASGTTGSGATMRMFRKEAGSKGAKIGIVFHCQDTEEDAVKEFDEDRFIESGGQMEPPPEDEQAQAVRFGVTVSKGGKTVVIQCRSIDGADVSVESVMVRDGDTEAVLAALAGGDELHAALYQGPEFEELAEDLQDSFKRYVVEECGVDEDVAAYIAMYSDYREQEEYVSWMKTTIDILD